MLQYNSLSDTELATHCKEGDEAAFAEIFGRYHDVLYVHAFNKLRNNEEAKDVVQEVFAKFWNKRELIELRTNLSGYLYVMVRNSVFSLLSHKSIVHSYAQSFNHFKSEGEAVTDYRLRERQLSEIIAGEIRALPPRMGEVFKLSRNENLTNRQIAENLGISEHTVADQIKKALRQLRIRLGTLLLLLLFVIR